MNINIENQVKELSCHISILDFDLKLNDEEIEEIDHYNYDDIEIEL